jgi:hypothetical protein
MKTIYQSTWFTLKVLPSELVWRFSFYPPTLSNLDGSMHLFLPGISSSNEASSTLLYLLDQIWYSQCSYNLPLVCLLLLLTSVRVLERIGRVWGFSRAPKRIQKKQTRGKLYENWFSFLKCSNHLLLHIWHTSHQYRGWASCGRSCMS